MSTQFEVIQKELKKSWKQHEEIVKMHCYRLRRDSGVRDNANGAFPCTAALLVCTLSQRQ